jgi:hypothetical protein
MKRALVALAFVAGCTPTVILGTLSVDGGSRVDLAGSCQFCDLAQRDLLDLGDGLDGDGGAVLDAGGDAHDL